MYGHSDWDGESYCPTELALVLRFRVCCLDGKYGLPVRPIGNSIQQLLL